MSQAIEDEFRALPRRQVILTMGGVMMGLFLASLDQTIVGTALPRIVSDLGGFELYAWVATAYMMASTVIVPIVGRLTDMSVLHNSLAYLSSSAIWPPSRWLPREARLNVTLDRPRLIG